MNFRQRFAWILLFLYLGGTIVVVYHIFDIVDRYGAYTVEHTKQFHSLPQNTELANAVIWYHVADVPFYIWMVLGCIPYLQFFWILFLCTKSQPSVHFRACVIPIIGWFYICNLNSQSPEKYCLIEDDEQHTDRIVHQVEISCKEQF